MLALLLHVMLGVALVTLFGWWTTVLVLILPRLLACAPDSCLFYTQHNFPGMVLNDRDGWTFEKAALESSGYLKMGPFMAWFSATIGYHRIHHLNHRVPFCRLPELYRDIPELRQAKTTTLHPLDILRCLASKSGAPKLSTGSACAVSDRPVMSCRPNSLRCRRPATLPRGRGPG